jgi:hypothetical protein
MQVTTTTTTDPRVGVGIERTMVLGDVLRAATPTVTWRVSGMTSGQVLRVTWSPASGKWQTLIWKKDGSKSVRMEKGVRKGTWTARLDKGSGTLTPSFGKVGSKGDRVDIRVTSARTGDFSSAFSTAFSGGHVAMSGGSRDASEPRMEFVVRGMTPGSLVEVTWTPLRGRQKRLHFSQDGAQEVSLPSGTRAGRWTVQAARGDVSCVPSSGTIEDIEGKITGEIQVSLNKH